MPISSPTSSPGMAPKCSWSHRPSSAKRSGHDSRGRRQTMANRQGPFQAQDKLTFLLSLVPYLMDHDRVSVAEAASHFGVSPELIRDSVRLIGVSGVPGETASYQHGDL